MPPPPSLACCTNFSQRRAFGWSIYARVLNLTLTLQRLHIVCRHKMKWWSLIDLNASRTQGEFLPWVKAASNTSCFYLCFNYLNPRAPEMFISSHLKLNYCGLRPVWVYCMCVCACQLKLLDFFFGDHTFLIMIKSKLLFCHQTLLLQRATLSIKHGGGLCDITHGFLRSHCEARCDGSSHCHQCLTPSNSCLNQKWVERGWSWGSPNEAWKLARQLVASCTSKWLRP